MATPMGKGWLIALVLLASCGGSPGAVATSPSPAKAGSLGDTWVWNSSSWHRQTAAGPAPRYGAALAYDATRSVYVLFGGQTAQGSSDETWTWDGAAWKQMHPAHKPPARRTAAMAYDPTQKMVVLYGGRIADQAEGTPGDDTWVWNGTDWKMLNVGAGQPGHRDGPSLLTAGNRVVLFGGHNGNTDYRGDAWSWDGATWARLDTAPRPSGRGDSSLVWNPIDSSVLVFGGTGENVTGGPGSLGIPVSDAWSLTGGKWSQLSSFAPGRLAFANAIWDSAKRRAIVLLGMPCPDPSAAAWAWDGKAWLKLADPGMSARWGAATAQGSDGRALLFGGSNEKGC